MRVPGITVKSVFWSSLAGLLLLSLVLLILSQLSYEGVLSAAGIAYLVVSLAFSVSAFILVLRHLGISPRHDLAIRAVVILGSVFMYFLWVVLVYPIDWLLS